MPTLAIDFFLLWTRNQNSWAYVLFYGMPYAPSVTLAIDTLLLGNTFVCCHSAIVTCGHIELSQFVYLYVHGNGVQDFVSIVPIRLAYAHSFLAS